MHTNQSGLLYKEEVYVIVGAAMEVYNQMGSGFVEVVYQEAMELELASRGVPFQPQHRLPVHYKDSKLTCEFIADLVCYEKLIVELKAIQQMGRREESQVINYMKASQFRVGLLINFGDPGRLDWDRFVL